MLGILRLRNPIQRYPWGSRTAIAELLGRPSPAAEPQAELWMGAHPKAPSEAWVDGRWVRLDELVRELPGEILGPRRAGEEAELPFLLKVLAAVEPLSIQAHPDRERARQGFRREEELGVPRDAPHRNYRDPYPKPEILYALTPFQALRGFRAPEEIHDLLRQLDVIDLLPECRRLEEVGGRPLERFFTAYMSLDRGRVGRVLGPALRRAGELAGAGAHFRWIAELGERYPGDRGILAPALLHVQELQPGEAIYTGPGVLHAYLDGVGVELMTSSDNVLRGGLTAKHVDVPELLRTLRFEASPPRALEPAATSAGVRRFATPEGLTLEAIEVDGGRPHAGAGGRPAILLVTDGEGAIDGAAFRKGDSFLLPAALASYRITGSATLFRAELAGRDGHEPGNPRSNHLRSTIRPRKEL